ncbi:uncharacterized protein LOC135398788 isoform X2 [Ornithodoros turicata]|uniref:uncharacterized protein LOC135398788 isoform X2 n=1 Tax=Ornithodoros turicata TaxID=34597 RepID=UPI00313935A6
MAPCRLLAGFLLIALAAAQYDDVLSRTRRQVNVHAIPKTSFSCEDKQPGEYYADPEVKCQVYHICVPGSFGRMTKMSFACPNGTLFSQASRVCNSEDRVYCPLSERFYENVMGAIDTDHDEYVSSRGGADFHNVVHNTIGGGYVEAGSRRSPVRPVQNEPEYDYVDETTTTTQAPRRRGHQQSSRRFQPQQQQSGRNVRPQPQAPSRTTSTTTTTTTTTTTAPPRPSFRPFRPPATPFRGPQVAPPAPQAAPLHEAPLPQAAPASNLPHSPQFHPQQPGGFASGTPPAGPPPLPQNVFSRPAATPPVGPPPLPPNAVPSSNDASQPVLRVPQRPQLRRPVFTTTTTTTQAPSTPLYDYYDYEEEPAAQTRNKRAVPVKAVVLPVGHKGEIPETSFTCQDKIAGGVYADSETNCELFHICVPVGKGKLLDYGLLCEEGTAFNQETGTCDEKDTFSCDRSLQLSQTDKTKVILADKKPWKFPKTLKRTVRDVKDTVENETQESTQEPIPETSFTCKDKIVGGYYADVETDCRVFHICTQKTAEGEVEDMRFLCTNGTVFDQKNLVCQKAELVSCEKSPEYYNRGFLRYLEDERRRADIEEEEQSRADAFKITKVKSRYPKKKA